MSSGFDVLTGSDVSTGDNVCLGGLGIGDIHFKEWRIRIFRLVYLICLLIVLDGFWIASQLRNFRFYKKDILPLTFFRY
jgi:hypothetical protein